MTVAAATAGRARSLDGLRGLAALVVVVHHCLIALPAFGEPYRTPGVGGYSSWTGVINYSPLHVVLAGSEAVYVFFVLSGVVLALGPLGAGQVHWRSYYVARLARLYLPVTAAVLLGAALLLAWPPRTVPGASSLVGHEPSFHVSMLVKDISLLHPGVGGIVGPLWSLRWEMIFSLALPLFLLLGRARRALGPALVVVLLLAVAVGSRRGEAALIVLPVFALGVMLAVERARLTALADRYAAKGAYLLVAAVVALTFRWSADGLQTLVETPPTVRALLGPLGGVLAVVGAVLTVLVFWLWAPAARLAERPEVQWLGSRSFSLYLVHGPVLRVVVVLTGEPALALPLALPLSLLLTEAFFRVVERPSHRLSQHWGARCRPRGGAGVPERAPRPTVAA